MEERSALEQQVVSGERSEPAAALVPESASLDIRSEVLRLQRSAGNRAVNAMLQRGRRERGGRGGPSQAALKSAPHQSEYEFRHLSELAQAAIKQILAGNERPYLRPARGNHKAGWHATDPETGVAKARGIGVREYHVVAHDEGQRIVVRSANNQKTVYYDPTHAAGTYTYHRVKNVPVPVAQPQPQPVAPAPQLPAVQAPPPPAPAPVPVPYPILDLPEVDDWEQLAI